MHGLRASRQLLILVAMVAWACARRGGAWKAGSWEYTSCGALLGSSQQQQQQQY